MRLAPLVLLLAAACASQPIASRGPLDAEAAYTAVYPDYVEFCALSEQLKKPGFGVTLRGGLGGHSTLYLNGACLTGPGYPELRLCDPATEAGGTGLSVNAHFANAKWVGVPGRDFFYHGDLRPGQALTPAVFAATQGHARRLGLYDAIRFHDAAFADMPAGQDREAFRYEDSIATDYALGYGRDRYCARVPVARSAMARIVALLNAQNRPFRDGRATYVWSVFTDNCIHLAHNALARIGFWPEWPTGGSAALAVFDFPVPKNEFVDILRRANDEDLGLAAVWDDPAARSSVLAGEGFPARPGALAVLEPAVQDNQVYDVAGLRLIFYDEAMFGPYEGWYRRIMAEPRYSDLAANRADLARRAAALAAELRPLAWWRANDPARASDPEFALFHERYGAALATLAGAGP